MFYKNSEKHKSTLTCFGWYTIQNMSDWFLILYVLKFLYNVDFNF